MVLEQISRCNVRVRLLPTICLQRGKGTKPIANSTESYLYRYSWDPEHLRTYPWSRQYVYQAEVLQYLRDVVDRFELRKDVEFQTELTDATWDESGAHWLVSTSIGVEYRVRYLVTALGLLSKQNWPDIPGIHDFEGQKYHTGRWPDNVRLDGKRVGVIGNGSTGVQVITEIAKDVKRLVSFQRNPQYSVPSGQRKVTREYRKWVNENYDEIWRQAKDESDTGFGFQETKNLPTLSVDEERRRVIFEDAWQKGGGFRFMFGTFSDIAEDEAANDEAANFIKNKIRQTVKDPEKARKLLPTQMYARRPLCDAGYYEQFNRDNVDIVCLHETPISRITPRGIEVSNGTEYELDVIIFATGFDAVDGNYTRTAIRGRGGELLKDHWSSTGPTSYLGVSMAGFPNMFMVLGPNGPFCNIPPAIESQVDFITALIEHIELRMQPSRDGDVESDGGNDVLSPTDQHSEVGNRLVEATVEAETSWTQLCDHASAGSLFRKTDSWIFWVECTGQEACCNVLLRRSVNI